MELGPLPAAEFTVVREDTEGHAWLEVRIEGFDEPLWTPEARRAAERHNLRLAEEKKRVIAHCREEGIPVPEVFPAPVRIPKNAPEAQRRLFRHVVGGLPRGGPKRLERLREEVERFVRAQVSERDRLLAEENARKRPTKLAGTTHKIGG